MILVVVHGSNDFDVREIYLGTVELEGMPVKNVLGWPVAVFVHYDRDGHTDVLILGKEVRGALELGDTTATLTGMLVDGTTFQGVADICIWPRWSWLKPS